MSTRCNIIIKDGDSKMFFYRHSDGYPEGALPLLKIFLRWIIEGKIRNNDCQAAGWLILLGAIEYNSIPKFSLDEPWRKDAHANGNLASIQEPEDWKVGSIEPTTNLHGDIEYLYEIDLSTKEIECYTEWDMKKEEGVGLPVLTINSENIDLPIKEKVED